MNKLYLSLAAIVAALASSSAMADPAQSGADFVQENCALCHAVTETDHSPNPRAIPFRFLGRLYPIDYLEEALNEGIMVGHEMPSFLLEEDEAAALITYLESIQVRH